jgi:aminopeptidase N
VNSTATSATVYLKDYAVPEFFIPEIELDISLFEDEAAVRARLTVKRNDAASERAAPPASGCR